MLTPFLIILNHFFSDFILQTDKMAQNKSKSDYWLTIHVLAYGAGFLPFTSYVWYQTGSWLIALCWLLLNLFAHWVTDFCTSRINSKLWAEKKVHWFFVSIGFDQVIHYGCLLFTYQWIIDSLCKA